MDRFLSPFVLQFGDQGQEETKQNRKGQSSWIAYQDNQGKRCSEQADHDPHSDDDLADISLIPAKAEREQQCQPARKKKGEGS